MPIRRFEELEAWQVARDLANMIYELTQLDAFRKDFGMVDQINYAGERSNIFRKTAIGKQAADRLKQL